MSCLTLVPRLAQDIKRILDTDRLSPLACAVELLSREAGMSKIAVRGVLFPAWLAALHQSARLSKHSVAASLWPIAAGPLTLNISGPAIKTVHFSKDGTPLSHMSRGPQCGGLCWLR